MRKHHRRADWLYSAQLVACLVHIAVSAVSVIFSLLRKTLLVTVSFQLIFGCVFIYISSSSFIIKDAYQMKTVRKRIFFFFFLEKKMCFKNVHKCDSTC